ncbi:MAG: hypothetical protein JNL53_10470 [Cyclobacteriaceae bacterium]|nr:hypothetical protein [Cyclobacteriaceae bacterium]
MKKLFVFSITLLSIAACQEPTFKTSPASKENSISIVEPEADEKSDNKSARLGRFISNPYWNLYRGNNDGLWYNYSSNGTSWSSSLQVNSGALLDQSPQAIFFNDRLVVVHRGRYSSGGGETQQIYLTYSDDGINWTQINVPAYTQSTPALAIHNNKLFIFYNATSGGAIGQVNTTDLVNWSGSTVNINESNVWNYGLSAAVDNLNRIHLFYHFNSGGTIRMRSQSSNDGQNFGDFNSFFKDYGVSTGVDVDAVAYNGSVAMVFRGANYSVRVIPNILLTSIYNIPNAQTSRGPSITTYNGGLHVSYKGNSTNNIWYSYSTNGGVNWAPQTTHSGSTPSGPDVTAIGAH